MFGLEEFTDPGWQSIGGELKTPFVSPRIGESDAGKGVGDEVNITRSPEELTMSGPR